MVMVTIVYLAISTVDNCDICKRKDGVVDSIGCVAKCGRVAYSRGLCVACLSRLRHRISRGELTWDDAQKRGLCKAKRRGWTGMKGKRLGEPGFLG